MTKEIVKLLDDPGPHIGAIQCGKSRSPEGEHTEQIFTSPSFLFDSPEDAPVKFAGEVNVNLDSHHTTLTVRAFKERLTALE